MGQNKKVAAVILMGGSGERFSKKRPKQFYRIGGKRIYLHTLSPFLKVKEIDQIVLVTHPEWIKTVKEEAISLHPNISVIAGGKTRQASSFIGLQHLSDADIVIVHDGARPFVTTKIIEENIEKAAAYGAVDTCIPSTDTIVHSASGDYIDTIGERKSFLRGQTPQTFAREVLIEAHTKALANGITNASDDCQLLLKFLLGKKIAIATGDETNIKITSFLDIYLADQLLRIRKETPQPQDMSLKGKIYAVVGASGGIGSCVTTRLEEKGAKVIPLGSSSKNTFDLKCKKSIEKSFHKIEEEYGPINGLINCGGFLQIKALKKLSYEEIEEMMQINLLGLIYSSKVAKIKKGGAIINIASSCFSYGRKDYSIYSAAKAGVVNFTQSFSQEREDIRVNCVVPARTDTKMRRRNFPNESAKELLEPDYVAKRILEVICDENLTGSIVDIKKDEA